MVEEQIVNEEKVETPEPAQFKEEGDELLVHIGDDKSEEAPEADPDEGQAVEDKAEVEEVVTEAEYEAPEEYKGKTQEELIAMVQSGSQKISEMGNEKADLKKQLDKVNLTPEELREQLKASEVKTLLDQEREKLMDIDPDVVSKEELRNQQRLVNELSDEYSTKSHAESIRDIVQSGENKAFKVAQKDKLQKDYELTAEEVTNVDAVAENNYLENGKLTERSYQHAMLSIYGAERMVKSAEMKAEAKARTDIMTASAKPQAGVDASAPGTSGNYVSIDKLISSPSEMKKYVATHTPEQVAALQDKLKQLM
jgi:hypothetical protein